MLASRFGWVSVSMVMLVACGGGSSGPPLPPSAATLAAAAAVSTEVRAQLDGNAKSLDEAQKALADEKYERVYAALAQLDERAKEVSAGLEELEKRNDELSVEVGQLEKEKGRPKTAERPLCDWLARGPDLRLRSGS